MINYFTKEERMVGLSDKLKLLVEELKEHEIELPRVYEQPPFPSLRVRRFDGAYPLREAQMHYRSGNGSLFGKSLNKLIATFQPAIHWAISCWDYLLSTQGVRFILRHPSERACLRDDYRAFVAKDYVKLVYATFKKCVLDCEPESPDFLDYIQKGFWNRILDEYRRLENPEDPRQRKLTPYSYLRCTPYQFLNSYHHRRVHAILDFLQAGERQVIALYFLNFFREEAVAHEMEIDIRDVHRRIGGALRHIFQLDPLARALLLQIERY